jgi:hypothetical protein
MDGHTFVVGVISDVAPVRRGGMGHAVEMPDRPIAPLERMRRTAKAVNVNRTV